MRAKKVAVLETRLGAQPADLVAQRGGVPFHAPALAELPDLDPGAIGALLRSLEEQPAKAAIFQTGVGTKALFSAADALGVTAKLLELLSRMVVAVRGPKPTAALRARGVRIDRSAADPFTTREVLECMRDVPVRGERVIVQRYGVVNVELDKALGARGGVGGARSGRTLVEGARPADRGGEQARRRLEHRRGDRGEGRARRLHGPHRQPFQHPGQPGAQPESRLPAAARPGAGQQGE